MKKWSFEPSGGVAQPHAKHLMDQWVEWGDLSPLEQGFIEAMSKAASVKAVRGFEPCEDEELGAGAVPRMIGFSDLASETLELIRKDCAAFQNYANGLGIKTGKAEGESFYRGRQAGSLPGAWGAAFPPLTPHLGDDGLIHLRDAAR